MSESWLIADYVDSMPCDAELLEDLGRVTWAAARLHSGVRDAINKHHGEPSDRHFGLTLGQAISELKRCAKLAGRDDQVQWADAVGMPATKRRNQVIHAVSFTATDGKQAIGHLGEHGRYTRQELREVTLSLIRASMELPI